jgi:hypothetical protein
MFKRVLIFIVLVLVLFGGVLFFLPSVAVERKVTEREQIILNIIKRHDDEIDPANGLPWGTHNAPKGYHSNFARGTRVHPTRQGMERAVYLLASPFPEHHAAGNTTLEKILELQDKNPTSPTFGVWPWYAEEPLNQMAAVDYNWADFQGAVLIIILHDFAHRLRPEVRANAERSLEYCCRAIIKRNVGPNYTNIAITGATVTAAAGEILRRKEFLDFGRSRILRSLQHYKEVGSFGEYNSPAYFPVVIEELERMLYLVSDKDCRRAAEELLSGTWLMVGLRYHVPTGELAGPHSRSYSDRLPGRTKSMFLARAGQIPTQNAAEAAVLVPIRQIDDRYKKYFLEIPNEPREVKSLFVKNRTAFNVIGTTWLDKKSTIGTASYHTFWEQSRGLIGYWKIDKNKNKNETESESGNLDNNRIQSQNEVGKIDKVDDVDDVDNVDKTDSVVLKKLSVKQSDLESVAVLRLRFKHDGNDFASAWGRHYQRGGRIVTAIGLLNNQGSMHPSMDRPANGIFRAKSFEIVYQLDGLDVSVRRLDEFRYELSAGVTSVIVHTTPQSQFDGNPIVWETASTRTTATLTGICYRGKERDFDISKIQNTQIAVGLELLDVAQDGLKNSLTTPIKITESNFQTGREGKFYQVIWQNVNENAPLLAPINPTQK